MANGLFVIGTGTDVGKTYVTGLLVKALHESGAKAAYYKAAMSGNKRNPDGTLCPGDAAHVKAVSGIPQPLDTMCPYVYERAVSPHLAARLEGNPVNQTRVLDELAALRQQYDFITMEGAGGILCPLRMDEQTIWLPDLIRKTDFPCLLVADAGLGTINAVGLTAFYLRAQQLPLAGIVFNRFVPGDVMHEDNRRVCEQITGAPVITCVQEGDASLRLTAKQMRALYDQGGNA